VSALHDLFDRSGQSPWIDNLRRDWLRDGTMSDWAARGVRGCTSNPSIFQKAMTAGTAYDDQLRALVRSGSSIEDAYWAMVRDDIADALALFEPVHGSSNGGDGFVSLELAPEMARDTDASIRAARKFFVEFDRDNLMVKIPGTAEGIPAVLSMVAEGRNVNITLIFGLPRYAEVMEAYLSGLEAFEGDLSQVRGVASFFISRVDTEVDRRLEAIGSPDALALRGKAAVAQARLAYRLFRRTFSGPRWEALASRGANLQRPLWASTSTKNPAYPPTLYVDTLIGPDTVNTMPEQTLELFEKRDTDVRRTVDEGIDEADEVFEKLAEIGVDIDDVSSTLEDEGVASFSKAYDELLASLGTKAGELT
jgi:transaldolase